MSSVSAPPRRSPLHRVLRPVRRQIAVVAACLSLAGAARVSAQNPGDLDTSFLSAIVQLNVYAQALEYVGSTEYIFAGGNSFGLDLLNGTDGNFNEFFSFPDIGNTGRIIYTAVPETFRQADGTANILFGGQFGRSVTQLKNNLPPQNIARVSLFGIQDPTFNVGRGANGFVTAILPLAGSLDTATGVVTGGDIIVAGAFDTFNKQTRQHLARLHNDGSLVEDGAFDPDLSFDATILSIAPQMVGGVTPADPQILVAGQFSNVNGTTRQKLARINPDGSLDASFNPTFDDRTTVVVSQPDGKILVGGDFSNVNGQPAKHLVRLNYDGSTDATFVASVTGQPFGFIDPPAVYVIKLLDDGSMYLGGNFTTVNGFRRNYLARVFADGTLDEAFDASNTLVNAVQSLNIQADGKLLVGVNRSKANGDGVYPRVLLRLFAEPPTLSLVANKPVAGETSGRKGIFTLTRGGNTISSAGPLTVYFQLSGDARQPLNYTLKGLNTYGGGGRIYSVTLVPGQESARIKVVPSGNLIGQANSRSVTLTVIADPTNAANYGTGQTATVNVTND